MPKPDSSDFKKSITSASTVEQNQQIAEMADHWLELFDRQLADQELGLPNRPLRATIMLLNTGAVEVRSGETLTTNEVIKQPDSPMFRALYAAVEYWYITRFGEAAMLPKGNSPLEGAIMILGTPFALSIPANRTKVENTGELAWLYFDAGVGEGEHPESWILNSPILSQLDASEAERIIADSFYVADTLRYVQFRRLAAPQKCCEETQKLVVASLVYLQQAARRMLSGNEHERGPGWFDLQMANEAALKAVIRSKTGQHPHDHILKNLLKEASSLGVDFDAARLNEWPRWNDICDWRYAQGRPWPLNKYYQFYMLSLELVRSAMEQIPLSLAPGFGLLIRYAPWKEPNA